MAAFTLTGDNTFQIELELNNRISEFVDKHGSLGVERLDGSELNEAGLTDSLSSTSLFGSDKIVIIKDLSSNPGLVDTLEQLIDAGLDGVELIIVELKLDQRSRLFKLLKTKTEYRVFNHPQDNELVNWAVEYAAKQDGHIDRSTASYLIERVGPIQKRIAMEIDKLVLYDPNIGRESIELLVELNPKNRINDLLTAVINRDQKNIIRLHNEQKAFKDEPQKLLGLFAWQLHLLALVKYAKGKSDGEIANDVGVYYSAVAKARDLSQRLSVAEINLAIRRLLEVDRKIKTASINIDDALLHYYLSF